MVTSSARGEPRSSLRRITAPPVTPVTLAEAKAHLRVDDTNSDTKITAFIEAATGLVEEAANRALVEQVWELVLDGFPADPVQIPLPPLIAIVSVGYLDEDGAAQTLVAGTDYVADPDLGWIVLPDGVSWPTTFAGINAVTIRFRAGYASGSPIDGEAVPEPIKQAILMQVGEWFDKRESAAEVLSPSVKALLSSYRVWR